SRLGEMFEKIPSQSSELINGLITGVALGLLWSPCAGPILATITSLAATQSINWKIALLTLSYSFGAAIPMFFITYGGNKIIQMVEKVSPYTKTIRKLFGMLMIISALTIAFNADKLLQILTLKYFPTIIIYDT